jgi:hypothetical protein
MELSRRDVLRKAGTLVLGIGSINQAFTGCTGRYAGSVNQNEAFRYEFDERFFKYWDPIFGPPLRWSSAYGGLSNFEGHLRGGATPGVDYDVPMNTPLVPMMASYLRQATEDKHGSLYILLINKYHPSYRISYGHLNRIFLDRRYFLKGEVGRAAEEGIRALTRDQVVSLSGNSGIGLLKNRFVHPPHLHITLYYLHFRNRTMAYLDPERYGLDGGRPVFWDGETDLDVKPKERISHLELTLNHLEKELHRWAEEPELEKLKGTFIEYGRMLNGVKGKEILDSKYFHEMRALLKKVTLEEKRFFPGTRPYSMMLKVVGYSMDESQEVILTLPFIAPGLTLRYRRISDGEGMPL